MRHQVKNLWRNEPHLIALTGSCGNVLQGRWWTLKFHYKKLTQALRDCPQNSWVTKRCRVKGKREYCNAWNRITRRKLAVYSSWSCKLDPVHGSCGLLKLEPLRGLVLTYTEVPTDCFTRTERPIIFRGGRQAAGVSRNACWDHLLRI